jgi:SAM-dependent methyltransferase
MLPSIEAINHDISPTDVMHVAGQTDHYYSTGKSALTNIYMALDQAGNVAPQKILDFGAGAGRVTRWLVAAFPEAEIHACDVRDEDMAFCREALGVEARPISPDVGLLKFTGRYDLIWVGSVITHLSAADARRLVNKLFDQLEPNGVLAVSFHGRYAIGLRDAGKAIYIHDEAWQTIREDYFAAGYGYADYQGTPGYGISVTRLAWVIELVAGISHCRLVQLTERSWDNHHDVVAIQRIEDDLSEGDSLPPDPPPPVPRPEQRGWLARLLRC